MNSGAVRFAQYSVLVAGAGSIGRRHLANLRKLGVQKLVAADTDASRLEPVGEEFGVESFLDLEEALATVKPDVVFVCTPPAFHVQNAMNALRCGADVFIEKPLADNLEGVSELKVEAGRRGRVVQVGYNLRFHPGLQRLKSAVEDGVVGRILWARAEVGQYLPDWRPSQDYRHSYTARRELGGGIILDASHEIDYVMWLLGPARELTCMAGRVSSLEVDVEDCATILMRLHSCAQVDVHMDFVQRSPSRSCVLAGERGKLEWDSAQNEVRVVRPEREMERLTYDYEANQMYVAEVEYFFSCVQSRQTANSSLIEAEMTLKVALAALTSAAERRWVSLDS